MPGLAAQHTCGIQLLGTICSVKLENVAVKSSDIEFHPGQIEHGGAQYAATFFVVYWREP